MHFRIQAGRGWGLILAAVLGAWAALSPVSRADDDESGSQQYWENSLGMRFVPAGTTGVLFSIWDVRLKDFKAFVDATGYDATAGMDSLDSDGWKARGDTWLSPGFDQTQNDPVVGVSANDADAFCQWLTKQEQATGKLGPKQVYRLPTNAEWTAAVGTSLYPWGDQWPPPDGAGNYAGPESHDEKWTGNDRPLANDDGYARTSPVGRFKANAYGLYDMGGNVMQWTKDNEGWARRGASWSRSLQTDLISLWTWRKYGPDHRTADGGFRVVLVDLTQAAPPAPKPDGSASFGKFHLPTNQAAATPPTPALDLTADQARAVVVITGDNSQGVGFLVKTMDGPALVTTIHVLANNPNLKITTNTGELIAPLALKCAADRDVAMIVIKNNHYSALDPADDISHTVQPGDDVIVPGVNAAGVVADQGAKILGVGAERIELDNALAPSNSGGPVFHVKSGKVLGVATTATTVDISKSSPALTRSSSGFGWRLDTISGWEPYDWSRFNTETAFLEAFHRRSRCLDSYLNTTDKSPSGASQGGTIDSGPLDPLMYQSDDKIQAAQDNFYKLMAASGDATERQSGYHQLLFDLMDIANTDMDQIQSTTNFYAYDQKEAQREIDYRKVLKAELDAIGNDPARLSRLPRTNSSSAAK